jgi:hypothetical protein
MRQIILATSAIAALLVGLSTIASAAPVTPLVTQGTPALTGNVERVDYTWNHHHYHHRSWDKNNRHWRYYN